MENSLPITAEADIGERDGQILRDTCLVYANNLFPLSIVSMDIVHRRIILCMTRPQTLRHNRQWLHEQIKSIFTRIGLTDIIIDDPEERPRMQATLPIAGELLAEFTTQTTA